MEWTVNSSTKLLQDRWISLRADSCVTPEGHPVDPYYVLEYPDWVNVVALTSDETVILVRQYRHGLGRTILELPGGAIDSGDASPLAAARRELLEETGYEADLMVKSGLLSPNPATHDNLTHCFLATGCRRIAEPILTETERTEVVPVALTQFAEELLSGGLIQALHVGSAFFALAHIGRLQVVEGKAER